MDSEQIQFQVERRYLQCIVDLAKINPIPKPVIKMSSQVMQAMRPWKSWDEALTKAEFLVMKFPQFEALLNFIKTIKQDEDNQKIIDQMQAHLRNNDIDQALKIISSTSG